MSDQQTAESAGESNHMKEYGINIDGEVSNHMEEYGINIDGEVTCWQERENCPKNPPEKNDDMYPD